MKERKKMYTPPASAACIKILLEECFVMSARMSGIDNSGQQIQGEYDFEDSDYFDPDAWYE
jgi:hypothetical protein